MDPHKPEQPDNFNRRGYTDIALKLYGAYPPMKIELDQRKVEMHLTPEILANLRKVKGEEEFKKLLSEEANKEEENLKDNPPF